MMSGRYGLVLQEVGRLLGGGTVAALGTGPLLERFAADRDGPAFEALVSQHGPMVLSTCRRMLDDPHDVDDAFQATFLVLARKAGSIRDADRLGPWLHGVARRVATRSRALSSRRKSRERVGEEPAVESANLLEGLELREALDEELSRLPEKYRTPLVLCYLEGLTHDQAAEQLHWPVGTVRSRLAGGRDRLRSALTRRGLAPSAAVPAILSRAAIPQALLATTVRVATAAGVPSAHVATLVKGALIAMMWNKLKLVAAVGLMAGVTVGGAGVAAQQSGGSVDKTEVRAEEAPTTLAQLGSEIKLLRVKELAIEKKIKDLRAEHEKAILPLRKAQDDLGERDSELSQRYKKLEADTASTATDDRIKRLEQQVLAQAATIASLKAPNPTGEGSKREPDPAVPAEVQKPKATPQPSTVPGSLETKVGPVEAQPIVHTLNINAMGGTPPRFMVISAARDRVTMIDSATNQRVTLKLPKGATEIVPIFGNNLVSLHIKGPEVTRAAVYDLQNKQWYEYDLKEPATEVMPWIGSSMMSSGVEPTGLGIKGATIRQVAVFDRSQRKWIAQDLREPATGEISPKVTSTLVTYRIGRFVYRYSVPAKKWSVLELKREGPAPNFSGGMISNNETSMIQDGDLIHLYNEKTGEWTQIDTKEEK